MMFGPQFLQGPGYSVQLPPGFQVMLNPFPGHYVMLPPGSDTFTVPAIQTIRPVAAFEKSALLQQLVNFENPMVAMANLPNLGLSSVLSIAPLRREAMADRTIHTREFDALTIRQIPARIIIMVVESAQACVEVLIMLDLRRWTEFVGPCLQLLAGLALAGSTPGEPREVRAVIDRSRPDQVEYEMVNPDNSVTPLTSLPTVVGNLTVYNIDNSIRAGDIHGTGIVLGQHSLAGVNTAGEAAPAERGRTEPPPLPPRQQRGGQHRKEHDMSSNPQGNFNVGNVAGTGIAIGHGASAHVTITQGERAQLKTLIEQLRDEIQKAAIPETAKTVLLNKALPEMEKSADAEDPRSGLERGLERINDHLEGVGAVASKVGGIIGAATKIASVAGVAIKAVAPFLASLI